MYISLSNVFFASKFGWKTLYSTSHRLYLFFHRLYPTTQRLFYVIFHPVLSISNFWPSEVIYIFYILLSIVYIQLSLVSIFYFPPSFLYFVACTQIYLLAKELISNSSAVKCKLLNQEIGGKRLGKAINLVKSFYKINRMGLTQRQRKTQVKFSWNSSRENQVK